jgi:hypothetical protein
MFYLFDIPSDRDQLRLGDIVRHASDGKAYVVVSTHPLVVTRASVIDNPSEWRLLVKDGDTRFEWTVSEAELLEGDF